MAAFSRMKCLSTIIIILRHKEDRNLVKKQNMLHNVLQQLEEFVVL